MEKCMASEPGPGGRFLAWWQSGVIYQIYPRSFQDTDGDGIGDLNGIASRLGHFVELGIDAVWLSPIFTSPMADFGYDVADYCGIDPIFGTLDDFDRLLAVVHGEGLKLILDFVPNHTSDRHPWFIESRSSVSSARRDGISGGIRSRTAVRRTIGPANSVDRPGPSTGRADSITTMPTSVSSLT
jgi:hypothetical protein